LSSEEIKNLTSIQGQRYLSGKLFAVRLVAVLDILPGISNEALALPDTAFIFVDPQYFIIIPQKYFDSAQNWHYFSNKSTCYSKAPNPGLLTWVNLELSAFS